MLGKDITDSPEYKDYKFSCGRYLVSKLRRLRETPYDSDQILSTFLYTGVVEEMEGSPYEYLISDVIGKALTKVKYAGQ